MKTQKLKKVSVIAIAVLTVLYMLYKNRTMFGLTEGYETAGPAKFGYDGPNDMLEINNNVSGAPKLIELIVSRIGVENLHGNFEGELVGGFQ